MFKVTDLFTNRFGSTLGEWLKYGKYIFNGHLMIVLLFLIGYVAFSYQSWLQAIPEGFPILEIVSFVLAIFITYSSIFTYLVNADRVFLLPLEKQMKSYFTKAFSFSVIGHAFLLFLVLGVCMPLIKEADANLLFILLFAVFVFVKVINLAMRWFVQFDTNTTIHVMDQFGRFILNAVMVYIVLTNKPLWVVGGVALIYLGLFAFYYKTYSKLGLKWDFLIDQEENRMMKFYRFANMFAEVPHLRNEVKRRKYLDWILNKVAYNQSSVYLHLYTRAFLRSGDYFGLGIRLTVIGLLFISFVDNTYGIIIFSTLFIFLTAFQLIGLWGHYEYNLFMSIYPLDTEQRFSGFKKVYQYTLLIQTLILSIGVALIHNWLVAVYCLVAGIVFILLYSSTYVKKKVQ